MAKNKSSFNITGGLFNARTGAEQPAKKPAAVSPVSSVPTVSAAPVSTQGRKGCKLQRINMAFNPDIHDYIRMESRRRGLSITQFVNAVLEDYMKGPSGYIR